MEKYSQEGFFHKLPYVEPGSTKRIHLLIQEMREIWVQSLGWEDSLEEGIATHSSFLVRESCGQRSLAGSRVAQSWT